MAHILYKTKAPSMTTSDVGWYDAAKQVGKRANEQARRTDITAVISETCGHGAPACFVFPLAELHLNRSLVPMGRADRFDLSDRLWRLEHPALVGALAHEASHARHTRLMDAATSERLGVTDRMRDVITALEEPRIEGLAIREDHSNTLFIKAEALEIVAKDFKIAETPYGASIAAALLLARVDAGVLTRGEAAPFRKAISEVLDDDTLDVLEALWKRFLRLRDNDWAGMAEIAQEWLEALGMDPEDSEDEQDDLAWGALFGEGDPGESESEGKSLDQRIKARSRKAASKADEAITEARGEERRARKRAEREADAERREAAEVPHQQAFPSHGFSPVDFSHYIGSREANVDEKRAARQLAKALEELDYRDRVVTKSSRPTPPGRLKSRAAVGEAAARKQGRLYEGDLWQGRTRKVVDSTPLTIGLLTDISGSMSTAMLPIASTQYVLSTAGAHIGAKVASVHFGTRVHGVMPAGFKEKGVRIFKCGAGHEAFRDAALAIDKELNLLNGRGARLLIVLSDGQFVSAPHKAYATTFVPLAIRKGVAVMFLDFTGSFDTSYGSTSVDVRGLAPADVATLVGRAAAQELRRLAQNA